MYVSYNLKLFLLLKNYSLMAKRLWTREELFLKLNLYLIMPFKKLHSGTPVQEKRLLNFLQIQFSESEKQLCSLYNPKFP